MNPSENDILLITKVFRRLGIDLDTRGDQYFVEFNYLNNPDGSIRWVWPASSRKASFLHFYAASSLKAKIFAKLLLVLSIIGLSRFFRSGKIKFYLSEIHLQLLFQEIGRDFALFTGTVGPNRKALIWHQANNNPNFIKIPLSDLSETIIRNEKKSLEYLNSLDLTSISYPKPNQYLNGSLEVNDLKSVQQWRDNDLGDKHLLAIEEISQKTAHSSKLGETSFWKTLKEDLEYLQNSKDHRLPVNLIRKLSFLAGSIDESIVLPTSLYHGDFTPWNMFVSNKGLQVYDWELSEPNQPMLWDGFHFICQSGILVKRSNTGLIYERIQSFLNNKIISELVKTQKINPELHLKLYLLKNTAYYLKIYSHQPKWHMQVEWLLNTWNELASILIDQEKGFSQRQLLCMDLFDALQPKDYAALKFLSRTADSIPEQSDIDLCATRPTVQFIEQFLSTHPLVGTVNKQSKTFMNNYMVVLKDSGLLSVDTIWQFKRKEMVMLDERELLNSAVQRFNGIKTPSPMMDSSYTWLFYLLNGASVPEKYRQQFRHLSTEDKNQVQQFWKEKYSLTNSDPESLFEFQQSNQSILIKSIAANRTNTGSNKWRNKLSYYWDSLSSSLFKKGMIITFSGVDGAGKSTVIDNIRIQIEKGLRKKVIVKRHRPSILPILSAWKHGKAAAEKRSASTLPRQGTNKSSLSSLIRFAYYYFDYSIGQFYILIRYVWRGYVVIYDRYYFDFINDSKRSNINLPRSFTTGFYRFLIKPDLNFFLYASPEDILKRKQELDADTIKALTEQYLSLFEGLSSRYQQSKYIPIHNKELDQTLSTIYELVKTRA